MSLRYYHLTRLLPFALLLVFFMFNSCEYEPSGENFVDLEQPDLLNPVEIDLNLYEDTITCYWPVSVKLKINPGNKRIYFVKFFLNDKELYTWQSNDEYVAYASFQATGIYRLYFIIVTSTGTNSIADNLNAEGIIYQSREWVIIAKSNNIHKNISYALTVNGLQLSWLQYDGTEFYRYRVKDNVSGKSNFVVENSFLNSDYLGEECQYMVYVVDNNYHEHDWGYLYLQKKLPQLRTGEAGGNLYLFWTRPLYPDKIAEYRIFELGLSGNWTQKATLAPGDTCYRLSPDPDYFAESKSYYLFCVPKNEVPEYHTVYSSFLYYVKLALPGPEFLSPLSISCSGFYFSKYDSYYMKTRLYRYSAADDQVTPVEVDLNPACFSPDSRYLLTRSDSVIKLYDMLDVSLVSSVNMRKVTPYFNSALALRVSDNGTCSFSTGNTVYVYNMITRQLVTSGNISGTFGKISPNAKYLYVTAGDSVKIYSAEGPGLILLSAFRTGKVLQSRHIDFLPGDNDLLYVYVAPDLSVRSVSSGAVIRTMNIGNRFFNIDFCSEKVLAASDSQVWNIYDFNTGNLLKTVRSGIGTGDPSITLLTNNTIYYSAYKYFLNN